MADQDRRTSVLNDIEDGKPGGVWQTMNYIMGRRDRKSIQILTKDGVTVTKPKEIAHMFQDSFRKKV